MKTTVSLQVCLEATKGRDLGAPEAYGGTVWTAERGGDWQAERELGPKEPRQEPAKPSGQDEMRRRARFEHVELRCQMNFGSKELL